MTGAQRLGVVIVIVVAMAMNGAASSGTAGVIRGLERAGTRAVDVIMVEEIS